jgi:hypothetical protein
MATAKTEVRDSGSVKPSAEAAKPDMQMSKNAYQYGIPDRISDLKEFNSTHEGPVGLETSEEET